MDKCSQPVILTIEDDAAIRDSFHGYLEDLEYGVLEASDGETGLDVFRREQPDLVLLDLRMPGMDGLDVLVQIHAQCPDTPVIIISGAGRIEDVVEALRRGAHDFIVKPIEDLSILKHSVERCLERARLIHENRQYQNHLEEKVQDRTRDLAQANQRLRRSEEKYRLLFESMRHGFALCRPTDNGKDFRLLEANPAFAAMTDSDSESLPNTSLSALFPGLDFLSAAREGADRDGRHLEYHDTAQGLFFDMLVYRRTSGDLVLMLTDVTDRRRLKEQLQQAQKMEAIGTLAGGIAHDFNNILGGLMGYGELALLDLDSNDSSREKVEKMLDSCHRAKELVGRILSFSRQTQSERTQVSVDRVVDEVIQLLRAAIPTTVEIRQQINCPGASVAADPTQVHQILMNLCTNAQHAMHETGGVLTIAVECLHSDQMGFDNGHALPEGEYVCVSVGDTGTGMDAQTLLRAFEPYFTTKSKGEGTGLGLAVVHGLVKNWNGDIQVASVPGQGTTFRVALPRAFGEMEAAKEKTPSMVRGKGRILLIDDEEALVLVGQKMLEHAGYEACGFTCPEKALARFSQNPDDFDLVITDMTMPKLTGDKLKSKIHERRPKMPVILCTGYREVMEAAKSADSGFANVLMKPLLMEALLQAVAASMMRS